MCKNEYEREPEQIVARLERLGRRVDRLIEVTVRATVEIAKGLEEVEKQRNQRRGRPWGK